MTDERIAQVVGASAIGFGVFATATPRPLSRLFGISDATSDLVYLLRFAGIESAALGVNLLSARDPSARRRLLAMAAIVDGLDCVLSLRAGLSRRTALLIGGSTGAVALAAAFPIVRRNPA
jgi:hypothetical protein